MVTRFNEAQQMTRVNKMEQKYTDGLLQWQWYFVFSVCVGFGVATSESYKRIKEVQKAKEAGQVVPKYNIALIFPQLCVSFFVCTLAHGYYEYRSFPTKPEPYVLMLASFLYMPIISFINNKLWPLVQSLITGGKKDV